MRGYRRLKGGHRGWVNSVAFSHDSKYLASASSDRTVPLQNAVIRDELTLPGPLERRSLRLSSKHQDPTFPHNVIVPQPIYCYL
jgi:WD40 repeat protein